LIFVFKRENRAKMAYQDFLESQDLKEIKVILDFQVLW